MLHKIIPNYTHKHTCHFCGRYLATEGNEVERNCYYFDKVYHIDGVYHKYSYQIVKVLVPRCSKCNKHGTKSSRIKLIISTILFIIGVYIWSGVFANTNNAERTASDILIACGTSLICTLLIMTILGFIIELIFESKYDYSSFCDNYEPIKKLKEIGFIPRDGTPNPKSHNIKANGPLDLQIYKNTLSCITKSDKWTIRS